MSFLLKKIFLNIFLSIDSPSVLVYEAHFKPALGKIRLVIFSSLYDKSNNVLSDLN